MSVHMLKLCWHEESSLNGVLVTADKAMDI